MTFNNEKKKKRKVGYKGLLHEQLTYFKRKISVSFITCITKQFQKEKKYWNDGSELLSATELLASDLGKAHTEFDQ